MEQATEAVKELTAARERGVVRWFDEQKGYGFIKRESGEDVFVHFSGIQMDGYKTLKDAGKVEFEVKDGAKGKYAEHVIPLD